MDVKKGIEVMDLWTNEKHLSYLSFMEAAFVRKMFRDTAARRPAAAAGDELLPLDRQIPDCLESTLDLDLKLSNHGRKEMNEKKMSRRNEKSMRRRTSRPYDASPDQVVPQIAGGDNEGEGRTTSKSLSSRGPLTLT